MRGSKLEQLPFKIKEAASKAISSLFRDKYKSKYENSSNGFKQKKRIFLFSMETTTNSDHSKFAFIKEEFICDQEEDTNDILYGSATCNVNSIKVEDNIKLSSHFTKEEDGIFYAGKNTFNDNKGEEEKESCNESCGGKESVSIIQTVKHELTSDTDESEGNKNFNAKFEYSDDLHTELIIKAEMEEDDLSGSDTILAQAEQVSAVNSKTKYDKEYEAFNEWRSLKNIKKVSDNVLIEYFRDKAKSMKPSTLWSQFYMIKSFLNKNGNARPKVFRKTVAFLKQQTAGHVPKKLVLSEEQVKTFLCEAPDEEYLLAKVLLVFTVFGACRRGDLMNLSLDDVVDNGQFLVVFLRDRQSRSFTITNEGCTYEPYTLYRKYAELRPDMESRRLFVVYQNHKIVGFNTIKSIPKLVAKYLQLQYPEKYVWKGLKRCLATMLVKSSDLLTRKKHVSEKSLIFKNLLKKLTVMHSGVKFFKCGECGVSFTYHSKKHVTIHNQENILQCSKCFPA